MSDIFDFGQFIAAGNAANNGSPIQQTPITNTQNITYLAESYNPNSHITYTGDSAPNNIHYVQFSNTKK